jgi:hypothetical protein
MSVETSRVILYAYRIFIRSVDFLSGRKRRVPYQGPCLDAWKRKAKRYAHHPRHTSKNDRQSRKRKEEETPKKATLPIIQNTRLNPIPKKIQSLSNPSPSSSSSQPQRIPSRLRVPPNPLATGHVLLVLLLGRPLVLVFDHILHVLCGLAGWLSDLSGDVAHGGPEHCFQAASYGVANGMEEACCGKGQLLGLFVG